MPVKSTFEHFQIILVADKMVPSSNKYLLRKRQSPIQLISLSEYSLTFLMGTCIKNQTSLQRSTEFRGSMQQQSVPRQPNEIFYYNLLQNMENYFKFRLSKRIASSAYNTYSLVGNEDSDRQNYSQVFENMKKDGIFDAGQLKLSVTESRGIGCFLGLAICDALGASTEFMPFDKKRDHLIKNGFEDIKGLIRARILDTRSGAVGIWTDDCSMALAMSYSILLKNYEFVPEHLRYMFILWLEHGLGNGGRPYSIGLGGNISISMMEFMKEQQPYCETGEQFNNGNGSLMRLAPIPLAYSDDLKKAMRIASNQSLTTHNGLEAKECARLLASIIVHLVNRKESKGHDDWKSVVDEACKAFETEVKSVKLLAMSEQETEEMFAESKSQQRTFKKFNKSVADRNWNWKAPDFTYSPCRNKQQPGYIGSYCMDALSMALHTVWHTNSFKECALFNANIGGDCDTVGAIAGQIAGAVYGVDSDMLKLYSEMVDFTEKRYEVFLVAKKLINKEKIPEKFKESGNNQHSDGQKKTHQLQGEESEKDEAKLQSSMEDESQEHSHPK